MLPLISTKACTTSGCSGCKKNTSIQFWLPENFLRPEWLKSWWDLYSSNFALQPHCIGIRPEHIEIVEASQGLPAKVILAEHLGDSSIFHCQVDGFTNLLNVKMSADKKIKHDDLIGLIFNKHRVLGFDSKGHRIN